MSEKEWAYWSGLHKETPQNQIADSVIPIVESGLAQMVKNDFAIDDEVRFESTWGHTPDHMSVHIASRGQHAVITGDLIHSPVQLQETPGVPRGTPPAPRAGHKGPAGAPAPPPPPGSPRPPAAPSSSATASGTCSS